MSSKGSKPDKSAPEVRARRKSMRAEQKGVVLDGKPMPKFFFNLNHQNHQKEEPEISSNQSTKNNQK